MSDPMINALAKLVRESLGDWQLRGEVKVIDAAGESMQCIEIATDDVALLIARAPAGMPFRWVVTKAERKRTAASVNGVLRIVRQALAPAYQPMQLRISPLPAPPNPTGAA